MKDPEAKISQTTLEKMVDTVTDIDKVMRDRLFVLTVAAHKGWKIASDLSFYMEGIPK